MQCSTARLSEIHRSTACARRRRAFAIYGDIIRMHCKERIRHVLPHNCAHLQSLACQTFAMHVGQISCCMMFACDVPGQAELLQESDTDSYETSSLEAVVERLCAGGCCPLCGYSRSAPAASSQSPRPLCGYSISAPAASSQSPRPVAHPDWQPNMHWEEARVLCVFCSRCYAMCEKQTVHNTDLKIKR